MKTEEALNHAVERVRNSEDVTEEFDDILEELMRNLPAGKVKTYLREIEEILRPVEEIMEQEDEDRLDEALEALRRAKARLKEAPPEIPRELVRAGKDMLGEAIMVLKMMKGLVDLFE